MLKSRRARGEFGAMRLFLIVVNSVYNSGLSTFEFK